MSESLLRFLSLRCFISLSRTRGLLGSADRQRHSEGLIWSLNCRKFITSHVRVQGGLEKKLKKVFGRWTGPFAGPFAESKGLCAARADGKAFLCLGCAHRARTAKRLRTIRFQDQAPASGEGPRACARAVRHGNGLPMAACAQSQWPADGGRRNDCAPAQRQRARCALSQWGGRAGARPSRMELWRGRESGFLDAADFAGVHLREAEALAAEVFQRSADEIELPVVDDEEAVVE